MEIFETHTIDLSLRDSSTNRPLTANVYTLEGVTNVDGTLREMSIGQLVMAICLSRATELEADIVALMEKMSENTAQLEALTEADTLLVAKTGTDTYSSITLSKSFTFVDESGVSHTCTTTDEVLSAFGISYSGRTYADIASDVETKMDSLNTVSQEQLIELQSQTSKRDDTYNLISNVLKSINTVLTGNVNNM